MGWQFWIDRGGTFTDIVSVDPAGRTRTHKLLSENPNRYDDAAVQGIRELLETPPGEPLPLGDIDSVKMGTTVATNALLERQGEPTVLVTTAGFGDALRIGYQARPRLFDLDIVLPETLHQAVIEVDERVDATGTVLRKLDEGAVRSALQEQRSAGLDSVAIVLLHGYRYPDHELRIAAIASEIGFAQISVSSEVNPLMKLVSRGDTTVVDAYLSPILRRYVDRVDTSLRLGVAGQQHVSLHFMQSNGGLTRSAQFRGKDALLSGPAGGVVGMVRTAAAAGFERLIGFDMGGTSTDVSHYAGTLERVDETEVAGVRVRAPMIDIHTVAAGGGSVVRFDGSRMRVGPASAGADPGPSCYGNGGPLTVTDCNVLLGRLRPEFFPAVFGATGDQPLDTEIVARKFDKLVGEVAESTGLARSASQLAEGFLEIAVENMANAIKKISVQRGHDVSSYALVCFGGAGGQHACAVADRLGIEQIHIHPHAGVLSALGIGMADTRVVFERAVDTALSDELTVDLVTAWEELESAGRAHLEAQGVADVEVRLERSMQIRYAGSDTTLTVAAGDDAEARARFSEVHRQRFGFTSDAALVVASVQVEAIAGGYETELGGDDDQRLGSLGDHDLWHGGEVRAASFLRRCGLDEGDAFIGPVVVIDDTATTYVEPGWAVTRRANNDLVLHRHAPRDALATIGLEVDPVQLEIFNNVFMNVAEQMGLVLENTAASVNIKERLDFSCAVFDPSGDLIANAPHMPVHLGSMSESIKSVIARNPDMTEGDVFVMNAPYSGGTHLPDITVIKPVFQDDSVIFYVASRGHHADIGGMVPGSAPANSTSVDQEGVLLDNELLVSEGRFLEAEIDTMLRSGPYPARNPAQNIADLKAQVAACEKGASELRRVIDHYRLDVVHAYMRHVKDNAEESVRRVIGALSDCDFVYRTDDGSQVAVGISVDTEQRCATIDFTGTSDTHPGNFNAPSAIAHAAVLYVFRCLVDDDIPLNAGCMVPLQLVLPPDSMVNPSYPAAVIAGNVETSQVIVDALFGALGVVAAAQGTMNNFIWGNAEHQNYETICGGAGATAVADGCSAVHTHMTNSRLTDPEVLEFRYPVRVESFRIRHGSGGDGAHRGGDGVVREVWFGEDMDLNLLTGRRVVPPFGLAGGQPGNLGRNAVRRANGFVEELGSTASTELHAGDVVIIETPGGGGFGPPR